MRRREFITLIATTTIPIVFSAAADPVQLGLVASLNRPGSNVTGVFVLTNALEPKRLGLDARCRDPIVGCTVCGPHSFE
jgi:hypothetical protein